MQWLRCSLPVVLVLLWGTPAVSAPIRTTHPGTGFFAGRIIAPRLSLTHVSGAGLEVDDVAENVLVSYTLSEHEIVDMVLPWVRRTIEPRGGSRRVLEGLGDAVVSYKYRFYREVGPWQDRQAAVRFGLELPTGERGEDLGGNFSPAAQQGLQLGSGAWNPFVDLSFLRAKGRVVWGGSALYKHNTEGGRLRRGNELQLYLDTEYIVLPVRYDRPGKEVFFILEWVFSHRDRSRYAGATLADSGGETLFVAPGLQHAVSERLLVELSVAIPVYQQLNGNQPAVRSNTLFGFRYVY